MAAIDEFGKLSFQGKQPTPEKTGTKVHFRKLYVKPMEIVFTARAPRYIPLVNQSRNTHVACRHSCKPAGIKKGER